MLKSEDSIHDLKQESYKKDKLIDDLEKQIEQFLNERKQQQHEKQQEMKKNDEVDTSLKLKELNLNLQNEINLKQNDLSNLQSENNDLKFELNKLKERLNENNTKYQQQINEINLSKDKEIQYFQNERNKLTLENEKLLSFGTKLQQEKRQLEDELILYNEKKEAISKCEQQMNEILQMVNEERLVRDNLKYLASKLIQEVDTLRSQCIYTTPTTTTNTSSNLINNNNTSNLVISGGSADSANTNTWRNRCSERRDRINVQNLQVALEKEIQAKEDVLNENKSLKLELDLKQSRINELQLVIEDLSEQIINSNEKTKHFLKKQQSQLDYAVYDNLKNINVPTTTTTTISQLVNGDTLYAIDDDDDDNDEEIEENNNNNLSSSSPDVQQVVIPSSSKITNKSTPNTPITVPSSNNIVSINNNNNNNLKYSKSLKILPTQYNKDNNNLSNSSTLSSVNIGGGISSAGSLTTTSYTSVTTGVSVNSQQQHRFEVITFQTMERCEYCCGILYGICRQAVKCKNKNCLYLCHTKCRHNIPDNCPININQRVQLKGVDFNKGIGTLMKGNLKIPKPGGVKKGWTEHYVFLSNARLFICPIIDNSKAGVIPVQIVDIRDTQFNVSDVNESDVIHANRRDIPCIFKVIVTKLKQPADSRQQILFCAKDVNDKNSWIAVLKDLNNRLIHATKLSNNKSATILLVIYCRA